MTIPRNIQDSARLMRAAAIEKLRRDHGMTISRFRRSSPDIAKLITMVEPRLSGDPDMVIRAWLGVKPAQAAVPARLIDTGRPYVMSAAMRAAAERASGQPPLQALVSRVPPTREYERLA